MHIVTVIPITYIPRPHRQVLSYFSAEALPQRSLVEVSVGKRLVPAVVLESEPLEKRKAELKRASFNLKKIERVIQTHPILSEQQLLLAKHLSRYYFESLGALVKMILPAYLVAKAPDAFRAPEEVVGDRFRFSVCGGSVHERWEAYRTIINNNHAAKKDTLILFPEVLSAEAFYETLHDTVRESALNAALSRTPKQQYEVYAAAAAGACRVVVGTRSAASMPLPHLATIIVDDELNDAHASWQKRPRYDARRISMMRGAASQSEVIFGGELPSVASLYRAHHTGGASDVSTLLERIRVSSATTPLAVVDMRAELAGGNTTTLSHALREALQNTVSTNNKALLLVNRRGEYTVILCRDCGHVLSCDVCNTALVTMRAADTSYLFCRECPQKRAGANQCPGCSGHRFRKLGSGIQRVVEDVKECVPAARIIRLDSDSGLSRSELKEVFDVVRGPGPVVLVGTQMAVKPALLPPLFLSALVNVDAQLSIPEYNGEEMVLATVAQLQTKTESVCIWQTYHPEHRSVQTAASGSYKSFLHDEIALREQFHWPPYYGLVMLTWYDADKSRGEKEAAFAYDKLSRALPQGVSLYEPTEHPHATRSAWKILVKIPATLSLAQRNAFLSLVPSRWDVTVDPLDTL